MEQETIVEKRKIRIRFICMIIISLIVGFSSAYVVDTVLEAGSQLDTFWDLLGRVMLIVVPVLHLVTLAIVLGISFYQYSKAKQLWKAWDEEDEGGYDIIEHKLGLAITITNIYMVFHFFFFSATIELANCASNGKWEFLSLLITAIVHMVVGMTGLMVASTMVVNLEKKMNPEKRGDTMDMQFHKKWMDSCDEAQQKMIFEASYRGFKTGQTMCMILWVITVMGQLLANTGILPSVCVATIWASMMISYSVECIKFEKK